MSDSFTHTFTKSQAAALYSLLRQQSDLNRSLSVFYTQLERFIFSELTIEELENLEHLVQRNLI